MDTAFLITAFATLFVIIDPVGLMPIFIALTPGATPQQRRAIAIRACVIAFGILSLFAFFGEAVLGFIGISMPAFRIAGGLLLFLTALDMLFERRSKRREDRVDDQIEEMHDPSVFPIAIPLIAGPGSIATVILLSGQLPGIQGTLLVLAVALVVMLAVMLFFLAGGLMERALGPIGINVVTRLLGMLLAALSVQFILDGLKAFGFAS
ncbi:MarC family protein [Cognatishimia sp. SS12]|uniref:MarC family protein n=1 Tax=Cognatishimia sp. SS12 TaxID=2979465 RepID=UPI00232C1E0D|nr:MarC family protein [Cognatishimia sp. SS12]MDC0737300.1 MarC family protein [Cognatishimia sp. SS12]